MSLLFGGGGKKVKPQFTGLSVQTSVSNMPITIQLGKNRFAPNVIWQGDFKAHKQKQKAGKGLAPSQTVYTYSGSFILGLCWGLSQNVTRVWKDQSKETSYAALGFSLFLGGPDQDPWGYMTTAHPSEALGYSHITYLAVANYDLGQSNSLPQHSFEVEGPLTDTQVDGDGDADPALCVNELLNNDLYGAVGGSVNTITLSNLMSTVDAPTTGDMAFQTYCQAMGFGISPTLSSQGVCKETLERWTDLCNTALVWTGFSLKFIPRASDTITAHGVTYLPDVPICYVLNDDDYTRSGEGTEDPIKFDRVDPADAKNSVTLDIRNRANEYNPYPAEWRDSGLIDQFGLKPMEVVKAEEVCVPEMARKMAALMGQRSAYIRLTYRFTLPVAFCRLEPMDILQCYDPRFGTFLVRIEDIEEQEDDSLSITAKEYAGTVSASGPVSDVPVSNTPMNTNVPPGPVNPPILIQPPPTLTDGQPQIWAAVSGGDGTNDNPNWGGCEVWISTDGDVSYNQIGTIESPARMGVLTAALVAYGGANPDTTNTLKISSAMSDAEFSSATPADAAAAVTLCYIAPEGANVEEFLSYTDATLTATDAYDLDDLYRGLNASTPGLHAIGAKFARLDSELIFKYNFPIELIGETIYVKFVSFNIFGGASEDISSVTAYPITISNDYVYGISLEELNDVDTSGGVSDGDTLTYDSATQTWVPGIAGGMFRLYGSLDGKPDAGMELFDIEMLGDEHFLATLPENLGSCDVAPTSSVQFSIKVNGAQVGYMQIAGGATVATWSFASDYNSSPGDRLAFYAPTTQDPTLSGPRWTFGGTRS